MGFMYTYIFIRILKYTAYKPDLGLARTVYGNYVYVYIYIYIYIYIQILKNTAYKPDLGLARTVCGNYVYVYICIWQANCIYIHTYVTHIV
jgi:hypothetical protein